MIRSTKNFAFAFIFAFNIFILWKYQWGASKTVIIFAHHHNFNRHQTHGRKQPHPLQWMSEEKHTHGRQNKKVMPCVINWLGWTDKNGREKKAEDLYPKNYNRLTNKFVYHTPLYI